MMEGVYFSNPQLLWGIPILLVAGLIYTFKRAKNRLMAASRLAVFCLILAAAANPYVVATHTVQSSEPSITILADKTASMSVFDPDVATRLVACCPTPRSGPFRESPLLWETRSFSTPLPDRPWSWSLTGTATKADLWMTLWLWPGPPIQRCLPSRWILWSPMPALRYREPILP